jgi:hypothetical protein
MANLEQPGNVGLREEMAKALDDIVGHRGERVFRPVDRSPSVQQRRSLDFFTVQPGFSHHWPNARFCMAYSSGETKEFRISRLAR